MPNFAVSGLTKRQFLNRNLLSIRETLELVDARLADAYGAGRVNTSPLDVWVITYCEAGITSSGHVNPSFQHSEGEIGLYPLPSNVKFWNGPDAPAHNIESPVEVNAFHYYLYLGHLKNKMVKTLNGMQLYRDLFRLEAVADRPRLNARLLAAVVHGYFFEGNYDDDRVPLDHLLAGFRAEQRLEDIMAPTKYKHAGTSIISNRRRNIDSALADFEEDATA